MKKSYILIGVVLMAVLIGGYIYSKDKSDPTAQDEETNYAYQQDLGMFPYECENGSTFISSPLEGLNTVQLSADAQGMFTGTATLQLVEGTEYKGRAPDGQSVAFVGNGETMHVTVGSIETDCFPKPSPDLAPWNWGDPITS